jgi:hypothetical protein
VELVDELVLEVDDGDELVNELKGMSHNIPSIKL